ncbi:hypothetical protein BU15DRAFT_61725 [Melanogaster broomeanus]|nr:hypothetical protein BU15DRAFT_61725 [Melanogaster broomeanus]
MASCFMACCTPESNLWPQHLAYTLQGSMPHDEEFTEITRSSAVVNLHFRPWCRIRMVFRWVFIPWLQRELDGYRDLVLPHGVPNFIYESQKSMEHWTSKFKVVRVCQPAPFANHEELSFNNDNGRFIEEFSEQEDLDTDLVDKW